MSNQADHIIARVRLPPELRDNIAESAKAHNRSMNADMVVRLEQSFSGLSETSSLERARETFLNNQTNNLNYHLGCLEGKISACNYIVQAIKNGTGKKYDNDEDMQKELFKFNIILEQAVVEKQNIEQKLQAAIQDRQKAP